MISQFLACFREELLDSKVQVMAAQMVTCETAANKQAVTGLGMFMSLLPKSGKYMFDMHGHLARVVGSLNCKTKIIFAR